MTFDHDKYAFAAAALSLCLADLERGGSGDIRDVEVCLCEDGQTVLIYAPRPGETLMASFRLQETTTEAEFDSRPFVEAFGPSGVMER